MCCAAGCHFQLLYELQNVRHSPGRIAFLPGFHGGDTVFVAAAADDNAANVCTRAPPLVDGLSLLLALEQAAAQPGAGFLGEQFQMMLRVPIPAINMFWPSRAQHPVRPCLHAITKNWFISLLQ